MRGRALFPALAIVSSVWLSTGAGHANGPKFYTDDPLWHDPETQDASGVREAEASPHFDVVANSFLRAGERTDRPAVNLNTVDEVPDSSWFTNRVGRERWPIDRLVKGPDTDSGPSGTRWTIVSGKDEGVTPGFVIRDESEQLYFIKFDPPAHPEMASGAEVISTKFFHAFGYHVPENYIAIVRREGLVIGPGAMMTDDDGRKRLMTQRSIDVLLQKAARTPDGHYRALASKALEGRPVGPFRYYGTRSDDPNDIFPHEHRRELRGLLVFSAWLNHDESRSGNTLDTLVSDGRRTIVRHHLIDFGATLGSGSTRASSPRAGNEYLWESRPTLITMLTFGLYVRPWIKVKYPELPAVGRFESTHFTPDEWKPDYPNPAFLNARPEDRFWAARIVAGISDDAVRAVVGTAQYTDPAAKEYVAETLITRKNKIVRAWLNVTNPLVNPTLDASGVLTFENAAERAGVAGGAEHYLVQWSRFDNAASIHTPSGDEQRITGPRAQAPAALLSGGSDYIAARVRAFHPDHPGWSHLVMLYFRRSASEWTLVGLERNRE